MKPSEKAIEAAMQSYQGLYVNPRIVHVICEAAYAIDVDPLLDTHGRIRLGFVKHTDEQNKLLAAKDAEIERLRGLLAIHLPDDVDSDRSSSAKVFQQMEERIVELEAENARLIHSFTEHNRLLEAENAKQKDECERFHKPA